VKDKTTEKNEGQYERIVMPEIDDEAKKEFDEWLEGRPEVVKEMAETLKPWGRYRLKPTGQHCTLYSYSENRTVTIDVDGHDCETLDSIYKMAPTRVFGINPDDLEALA